MSNKVTNGVSDFNVEIYDNGFTLRYSGRDDNDDWAEAKIIVSDIKELCKLIEGIAALPRSA